MAMAVSEAMVTRFPPPEVLELIFPNLERIDLLNSRLVSKDWNTDCLSFFKKSTKFRMILDYKNSDEYIKFVSSSSSNPKVNPDHQEQNQEGQPQPQPQPVMPIHLQFEVSKMGHNEDEVINLRNKNAKRFQEFITAVKKLQDFFGPECVRDLTFIYPKPYEYDYDGGFFEKLIQVLTDLSPGLEKLDIRVDDDDCDFLPLKNEDEEKLFLFLPNVKHLSLDRCKGRGYDYNYIGMNTVLEFIQGCPNLETLVVGKIYDMDTQYWPSQLPFPPPGLKSVQFAEIPIPWLMDKINAHAHEQEREPEHTPTLRKLCILSPRFFIISDENESNNAEDYISKTLHRCREILRLYAPSLRSLTMPLAAPPIRIPRYGDEDDDDHHEYFYYKVPFPLFPVLKNLTIADHSTDTNCKIDPAAFPALETVSIPYDEVTLNWPEVGQKFLTVKSLTLRFSLTTEDDEDEEKYDEEEYETDEEEEDDENHEKVMHTYKIEFFHKLFRNISKIAFENNAAGLGLHHGVRIQQYLKRLLQFPADAAAASKIKVLELINFDQNYLGMVLEQIRYPPRVILENVRKNPYLDGELVKIYGKLIGVGNSGYSGEYGGLKNLKVSEEVVSNEGQGRPELCQTIVEQREENPAFENRLINIQKIRLVLTEEGLSEFKKECQRRSASDSEGEKLYHEAIHTPKKLYLNEMMANFPNLEEIEVSSSMFARDAAGRAERMKRIMEKYPGLRINIV